MPTDTFQSNPEASGEQLWSSLIQQKIPDSQKLAFQQLVRELLEQRKAVHSKSCQISEAVLMSFSMLVVFGPFKEFRYCLLSLTRALPAAASANPKPGQKSNRGIHSVQG